MTEGGQQVENVRAAGEATLDKSPMPVEPAAVIGDLLDRLRSDIPAPALSNESITLALTLCNELSLHLRTLLPRPEALETACDSICTTSESETEGATYSKSRPSAKARARQRRQMQQAQQQQVEEQTQEQQQWQQWQQWQSQWQWQHSAGVAANQLQERFEQLEQQFRSSLWNGGWNMVPTSPHSSAATHAIPGKGGSKGRGRSQPVAQPAWHELTDSQTASDTSFRQAMWSGSWQMVPRPQVQMTVPEETAMTEMGEQEEATPADCPTSEEARPRAVSPDEVCEASSEA
jgi:hypothetical protein